MRFLVSFLILLPLSLTLNLRGYNCNNLLSYITINSVRRVTSHQNIYIYIYRVDPDGKTLVNNVQYEEWGDRKNNDVRDSSFLSAPPTPHLGHVRVPELRLENLPSKNCGTSPRHPMYGRSRDTEEYILSCKLKMGIDLPW